MHIYGYFPRQRREDKVSGSCRLTSFPAAIILSGIDRNPSNILCVEKSPGVWSRTYKLDYQDLLQEIWRLKKEGLYVIVEWVDAHQDAKYPGWELDGPAKLNGIVDTNASTY
eukprot:5833280-Ditylum_brightwellii.AAC.1